MIRKIGAHIFAFVIALVVTGCATLPLGQTNLLGPEILTQDSSESLYYSPAGPTDGASQDDIVSGFLYAGNGPQDDYAVARQFLTRTTSSKWQPNQETLIQSGPSRVISDSGTKVRIEIQYDARITEDGSYISEPGSIREVEFRLLQENNEWRIASAPNLTALLKPNFLVLFKPFSLYFWDKSLSYLVPDVRWFPVKASLPTRLTNNLIAGPTDWLTPAVQTIFPKGTKLNINSVTVTGGSAAIDLNATALKVPAWKWPYLRAQLLATLSAVRGITEVSISVERTAQNISTTSSGLTDINSNLPIVLNDAGLHHIAGKNLFPIQGTDALVQKLHANAFAISSGERFLVLRGEGTVYSYELNVLSAKERLIDSRSNLVQPTLDVFNSTWTATSNLGDAIRVVDENGSTVMLDNPYGSKSRIRSLSMSPEGSRLLVLHDHYAGSSVDVFPVVRDKNRKVASLGAPLSLHEFGSKVISISWADRTSISGIVVDENGYQHIRDLQIGGAVNDGRAVNSGVSQVSTLGANLYYLDADGGVFASKNSTWESVQSGIKALRMAGQ